MIYEINSICNIFLYLNQNYAISNPKYFYKFINSVTPIKEMCLDLYCKDLLEVKDSIILTNVLLFIYKIINGSLQMIESHRNGENIDLYLLKKTVLMLSTLKLYENYFQKSFLSDTSIF